MKSNWKLYLLFTISLLSLYSSANYLLVDDELYYNALAEQMSIEQIKGILDKQEQVWWLNYSVLCAVYLVKFFLIACCLSLGFYFYANEWSFKPFFQITVQAEFILLIPVLVKIVWFLFIQTDYSLNDLQLFYPLSLLNLYESSTLEPYLRYPLQLLNIFEVAYWLALAYGVAQVLNASLERGFGLVAASYGSGLLIWVMFVMFLTVNLS